MAQLKINEIFYSLQGEAKTVGLPTVFIRLTGCPIRCSYCDTDYAFFAGVDYSIDEIIKQVSQYNAKYITVTGGEPLAQPAVHDLMQQLCDLQYSVSIETGGMLPIEQIDNRVSVVLDIKTPGSNEMQSNLVANYQLLQHNDQVKFVVCDAEDFAWAVDIIKQYQLLEKCEVLISPSYQELDEAELAELVLASKLPVRMQIQLHKFLWGDAKGR